MFGSYSHYLCLSQGWRKHHGRVALDVRHYPEALQLNVTFVHSAYRFALHCTASGEACAHTLADP